MRIILSLSLFKLLFFNKHFMSFMKSFSSFNLFILTIITAILLPSCASIVSKSSYPLNFNSDPSDARITIVNKKGETIFSGKTPATVTVKASSSYMSGENLTVTVSKPGYEDAKVSVSAKIEGWYWANLLFGGVIGMLIIDPLTGAMYKYNTDYVNVNLKKSEEAKTLKIVDYNSLSADDKKLLIKIN